MSTIYVHPVDARADAPSISTALAKAQPGDAILLGPGVFAPSRTQETLPLRLPRGVVVEGAGSDRCVIDGEGWFEPSFGPIRPDQAVVLLGDGSSLSGVEVTNGGGHGIGAPPGVSTTVRDCVITRHGDHGVYLCGVEEAIVVGCTLRDNGLKQFRPTLPRGTGSPQQGHHIFAESRHGQRNRLVIADNDMRGCFADGVAFVCFYPEPDGVVSEATIVRNTIEASGRGGLLFACSFGPSGNRQRILAAGNVLLDNRQYGIQVLVASPHADPVPSDNRLDGVFSENEISGSPVGIFLRGGSGESQGNLGDITIDRNTIGACDRHGVRIVGALGVGSVRTADNVLRVVLSRNLISESTPSVAVRAAASVPHSTVEHNLVSLRLLDNQVTAPPEQAFVVSDGPAGNRVEVVAGSQPYSRTGDDLLNS
jgi:hypothetical protein